MLSGTLVQIMPGTCEAIAEIRSRFIKLNNMDVVQMDLILFVISQGYHGKKNINYCSNKWDVIECFLLDLS